MLDIKSLHTFVAVAELQSFTQAAKHLHMTQSTVSQHIKRLEESVGQDLFNRTTRLIILTETGEKLFAYARQILFLEQEAREMLKTSIREKTIRIGAPEDFASQSLLADLMALKHASPHIRFEITAGLSKSLRVLHDEGKLDLVIVRQKAGQGGNVIRSEPLVWIDSLDHPVADESPLPLAVFPVNGLYRNEIFRILEKHKRKWHITFTSTSLSGILSAVTHGIGVSMVPRSAVQETHTVLTQHAWFLETPAMEFAVYHHPHADPATLFLIKQLLKKHFLTE